MMNVKNSCIEETPEGVNVHIDLTIPPSQFRLIKGDALYFKQSTTERIAMALFMEGSHNPTLVGKP